MSGVRQYEGGCTQKGCVLRKPGSTSACYLGRVGGLVVEMGLVSHPMGINDAHCVPWHLLSRFHIFSLTLCPHCE